MKGYKATERVEEASLTNDVLLLTLSEDQMRIASFEAMYQLEE